jgi:hypothetical protein
VQVGRGLKPQAGRLLRTTYWPTFDRRKTEIRKGVNAHRSVSHHETCPHYCMSYYFEDTTCLDRRSRRCSQGPCCQEVSNVWWAFAALGWEPGRGDIDNNVENGDQRRLTIRVIARRERDASACILGGTRLPPCSSWVIAFTDARIQFVVADRPVMRYQHLNTVFCPSNVGRDVLLNDPPAGCCGKGGYGGGGCAGGSGHEAPGGFKHVVVGTGRYRSTCHHTHSNPRSVVHQKYSPRHQSRFKPSLL